MNPQIKNFEWFFKVISYGVAACGLLSLFVSGGTGVVITTLFSGVIILAWFLEGKSWQISERFGVILIVLIVPLFYLDWKYQLSGFNTRESLTAGNLARLILILAGIKLLQKKADRDWIFIYLISFFEVLLATGLSISPLLLATLVLYLFFAICSIVAFEIRKSSRSVSENNLKPSSLSLERYTTLSKKPLLRLPLTAFGLLILILLFAFPLFFILPRVGGAGLGNNLGGLSGFTGFSDSVRLGEIGKLQQNNQVVMRVQIEKEERGKIKNFRWRGVALDTFDNRTWRKSRGQFTEPFVKNERGTFAIDTAIDAEEVITQTVYLEPLDTSVLFALSRPVAIQGNFQIIARDVEGSITIPNFGSERTSYKVFSDLSQPDDDVLRIDNSPYSIPSQRYLKLPNKFDKRISDLAEEITAKSGANNRFDQAKSIENYLQNNFGYTLELKAGGEEPLADFLFNVREGHCEYFATAMAVMLRTQGIATRVVNGFQQGEYNETADMYVVRQREAHSWVEVYFPKADVWVPFDPTPFAGRFSEQPNVSALGQFNKYIEALETFWIQYVVSYDNQEQRSLFRSVKNNFGEYQAQTSIWLNEIKWQLKEWWQDVRGDQGFQNSWKAALRGIGYVLALVLGFALMIWLFRKIQQLKFWEKFKEYLRRGKETSIVEFYERMQKILAKQGLQRQVSETPLEFAFSTSLTEAVKITEKYNRVRFGEQNLNREEAQEVEEWLKNLENRQKRNEYGNK
jgi:transglutaminase-like putative cysteine protease